MAALTRALTSADLPEPHLPWYWDTVGHRLAAVHEARHAGTAYRLAREAETVHGLPVDSGHACVREDRDPRPRGRGTKRDRPVPTMPGYREPRQR